MTDIVDLLLSRLSDDIEMTIDAETISVSYQDRLEYLKPVVYISEDETKSVITAVGSSQVPTGPHIQVHLFRSDTPVPRSMEKGAVLEMFFAYVLWDLLTLSALKRLARPRVILKGADSLNSTLCGYQRSLLRGALIKAGARECVFVS
jgi:hypothetical protein